MARLRLSGGVRRLVSGDARSRLAAIGHLVSGNFLNAAIMLVGTAIAARALGPADYGVLVMILAFGRTIERIFRFESWQPIIRFAAEIEETGSKEELGRLFAYGLLFDVAAAIGATAMIVLLAQFGGAAVGIDADAIGYVTIYALAVLLNYSGMPTAVLRLAGNFRTIAYSQLLTNSIRVLLAVLCWQMGAGLLGFVLVWTGAQIGGQLFFFGLSLRALQRQGVPLPFHFRLSSLRGRFPGFIGFAWSTNLSMTLRTLTSEADTLLVGAIAGAPAAGFYNLAKRLAKVAQQVGAHVQAVMYPDVARMWARGQFAEFRTTTLQVQAALGGAGIVALGAAWLLGAWAIELALGDDFASVYPLMVAQIFAIIFVMHAAPSRSALLAMHRPQFILGVMVVGTAIFFAAAFLFVPVLGAMGANIGHIAMGIVVAVALDIGWLRGLRGKLPGPRRGAFGLGHGS